MQVTVPEPVASPLELDAALLQAAITLGLAGLSALLFQRYRKAYFGWWTVAWVLYVARIAAIIAFLVTAERWLLFAHQVITGWTALALLWSAVVFSHGSRLGRGHLVALLFPPLWAAVAVYRLESFLLAALPMVLFLSFATIWSARVFFEYRHRVRSTGATVLAVAFLLWGLHHLDYPFLRAQGAWAPWGYYLDIVFELAVGAGLLLLVLDDVGRGVHALSALSSDLQRTGGDDVLDVLLHRPLTLGTVDGTALFLVGAGGGRIAGGAGSCREWAGRSPPDAAAAAIGDAIERRRPVEVTGPDGSGYLAALPVFRGEEPVGALLLAGKGRDPFAALDDSFLLALGQQVGAALQNADLSRRLEARRLELERLSTRMVTQHEEERRRLSRELHDESAQVFSAVKMDLAMLRDSLPPAEASRLDRTLSLIDSGIGSIRSVVNDLRPSLLDDLGLLPALRSLAAESEARSGVSVQLAMPESLPPLPHEAELVLYRALQELLTNVARHSEARNASVELGLTVQGIRLSVEDDGLGLPAGARADDFERAGHMGLAGMRERVVSLGGSMEVHGLGGPHAAADAGGPPAGLQKGGSGGTPMGMPTGMRVEIRLPVTPTPASPAAAYPPPHPAAR